MRWRTRDGQYTVEVVRLGLTGRHRDGEWLRVKQHGAHVADVRTVEELAEILDLADLMEGLSAAAWRDPRPVVISASTIRVY